MKRLLVSLAVASVAFASPAAADHIFHLDTPFDSRGGCEVERNELSNNDYWLLDVPGQEFFDTIGDVRSFMTRAFTCELSEGDGQWYMVDHRIEVLESEWFQQRR